MNNLNWIVVDLDGTLNDNEHRAHLAQDRKWDEFHAASKDDYPCNPVREVVRIMSSNYKILLLTGRNERYRSMTLNWLQQNHISPFIDDLAMRPDSDFRPDIEMKICILESYFGSKENVLGSVLFCLDDRDRVVEGFRNYGLPCFQVKQGEY